MGIIRIRESLGVQTVGSRLTLVMVAAVSSWMVASTASASEPVRVELDDGRTVSGQLDARTDSSALWLSTTAPSIVLRSAFDWRQVSRVRYEAKTLSSDEFRRIAPSLATKTPHAVDQIGSESTSISPDVELPPMSVEQSTYSRPPMHRLSPHQHGARAAVRSLSIEAFIANWDDDAEPDGLRVFVYPLDATGNLVAVNGTLDFTLVGEAVQTPVIRNRFRRKPRFPELGRWSRCVRRRHFAERGAFYQLPFRGISPEFFLGVAPDALLIARLGVPGQGRFDAADANVVLRPPSRIRDEFQQYRGRRYSPRERTRRLGL